jgi:hypothetical protein
VGHEEQPLSDVRSANARRWKIRRPDGVTLRLQISRNMVEPREPSRARNLLSKDDWRAALADEPKPRRPEMTGIVEAIAPASAQEGLAGATARPNRSVGGPSCEGEGVGPAADPCEEMALPGDGEVCGIDELDITLVNVSDREQSVSDKPSQPAGCEAVVLVVVDTVHRP